MEHAPGVQLRQKLLPMDVSDQFSCIDATYRTLKGIEDLEFPAYGSLYFADTPYIAASAL